VEKVETRIGTEINKVDQSQEEDPSPGIVKATIQVINSEARKTSSAGIVARWVTILVNVNLERRTMARAVQIVFQRRYTIALFAHWKARWNLGCWTQGRHSMPPHTWICSRTISSEISVRCILVTIKHATLLGKEM
jgi:hypothetical protein